MILIFLQTLYAQEEVKQPFRANINVGGMVMMGNLNQVQFNGGGMVSYSHPRFGNDLLINGFRMWIRTPGSEDLTKIGDDLHITNVGYRYVNAHVYFLGLLNYATSQLHQVDQRYLGGIAIGYAPVRKQTHLFRAALGGFWEHSRFPGDNFCLDVSHDGNVRSVPRIGLVSNGWYRIPKTPVSFRYVAWLYTDPLQPSDIRLRADTSMNIILADPLVLRVSCTYAQSSVVLEGVSTYDLRSNIGLGLRFPPKKKP